MRATWKPPYRAPPVFEVLCKNINEDDVGDDDLISVIMFDIDAPNARDRSLSPFLHYIRANIPYNAVDPESIASKAPPVSALNRDRRENILEYVPPALESILHTYQVIVASHSTLVNVSDERQELNASGLSCFDHIGFLNRNKMTVLHERLFIV